MFSRSRASPSPASDVVGYRFSAQWNINSISPEKEITGCVPMKFAILGIVVLVVFLWARKQMDPPKEG